MDEALALFLNRLGRGEIDSVTEIVCLVPLLVALWMALALAAFILDAGAGRRVAVAALAATGLHFVVSEGLLKHAILTLLPMRVRPWVAHPHEIVPVGYHFTDSSFPSSHAASTAAMLTVFGWYYPRARPLCAAFLLLMCLSRVHNGMHYPTDVLAGSILGVGYGLVAVRLAERWAARRAPSGVTSSA